MLRLQLQSGPWAGGFSFGMMLRRGSRSRRCSEESDKSDRASSFPSGRATTSDAGTFRTSWSCVGGPPRCLWRWACGSFRRCVSQYGPKRWRLAWQKLAAAMNELESAGRAIAIDNSGAGGEEAEGADADVEDKDDANDDDEDEKDDDIDDDADNGAAVDDAAVDAVATDCSSSSSLYLARMVFRGKVSVSASASVSASSINPGGAGRGRPPARCLATRSRAMSSEAASPSP